MRVNRAALGNLKFRKRILHRVDFYVAAARNGDSALKRFWNFAEDLSHFLGSLKEKLVRGEFHAMRIAHGLACLNAEQDFLGSSIGVSQVMAVIGGDQRNACFPRETDDFRIDALFDFQALVLNFPKVISFT